MAFPQAPAIIEGRCRVGLIQSLVPAFSRCGSRARVYALLRIRDIASTVRGRLRDKALGNIDTSLPFPESPPKGLYGDSTEYVPSGYTALTAILRHFPFKEEDVFVDLGCG